MQSIIAGVSVVEGLLMVYKVGIDDIFTTAASAAWGTATV
jgi:hypothetical protein